MDFLKSAVASAIAKGPLAGYVVGGKVELEESIWTLNQATKRVGCCLRREDRSLTDAL